MIFSSPQNPTSRVFLTLDNHIIPLSDTTKFLGVVLDKNLKFNYHVQSLLKKVAFGIHVLIKARPYFPPRIVLSLYYAYIHSHLSYCISSWGNTYATHVEPLQILQNQALRIINFAPFRSHSMPLYINLGVLPINELFILNLASFMYRLVQNNIFIEGLPREHLINTNNTRFSSRNNFLVPKVRTNHGKQTAKFAGVSTWNNIPEEIKLRYTLHSFRKLFKLYLLRELDVY